MEKKEKVIKPDFEKPIEVSGYEEIKTNVNEARKGFLTKHSNLIKKNKISSGIFFVVAIGMVFLGYFLPKLIGLSIGLICASMVVVWLYTRYQRKMMDEAVSEYLYAYSINCNSYLYSGEDFKDIEIGYKQRPDHELLKKFYICDDISQIISRELVTGKMYGHDFIAADVSLKSGDAKKQRNMKALLVGKAIVFNYSFQEEGRTLLYLKGCGDAAPTKLDDVNKVSINKLKEKWEVYTSHKNYQKIFTDSVIKALNKIDCDDTLNDVVISIVPGHVLIGLSYCDAAMVIPMQNDYETTYFEHKVEDFEKVKLLNKALIENENIKK